MNVVLDLTFPMFCILLCIGCGIGWFLWKKHDWEFKYWIIPIFLCYALMLIKLTMFPISIFDKETLDKIKEGVGKYFVFYQMIPFNSIKNYARPGAMVQLTGNLVLLAPLGLFAEIFLRQRPKAWKVVLAASSVSFLIEITQLAINFITGYPNRVADVDDLFLNIAGIAFTVIVTRFLGKRQKIQKILQKILYR